MAYTAQNLEHAVSVFYSSEHSERAEAHKWLTEAQRCPEAWSFVWDLLNSQKSTEVQFFAATTLHIKLQKCWAEVPSSNYEELKNRIMQAISMSFHGPKIVLNRLCISLAAFILQQGGRGLLETVQQLSNSQSILLLIEVLSLIPEEFNNMTMASSDRAIVRANLQSLTNQILELIMKHLQINGENEEFTDSYWLYQVSIWQAACQCGAAWIQLGGVTPHECIPVVTAGLQILHIVYRGRHPPVDGRRGELCQAELETCEAALSAATASLTQPDACRHPTSCCHLLRLLIDASEPILQIEDVIHTINEDLVVALYSSLVTAAEFHGRWIALSLTEEEFCNNPTASTNNEQLQNKREALRCAKDILRLMLCCSGAPGTYPTQESHSKLSFSFWFTLQDEGLCDSGNTAIVKQGLRIWYEQLVAVLLRKSTYPSPPFEFNAEDDELMRCYRQDISDTLAYCHTVLGNALVVQLENLMINLVDNCLVDGGCALEAVLNAFLALAEFVHPSAAPSLFALMKVLIELPYDKLHQQVMITTLGCFVSYAEWLGSVDNPVVEEIIGKALNITWIGVENKDLTSLAVLALKAFCQECTKYLKPHAHHLLQAIQAGQGKWAPLFTSILLTAAGCTAATLPYVEAAPYLNNLVTPLVAKLQTTNKTALSFKKIVQCSIALQQATSLLTSLLDTELKHAHIPLSLLIPTFKHVVRHHKLIEPLFRLIKLVITRLQGESLPFLPDLIHITNISLDIYPHPSNVEVCKMITIMFPGVGSETLIFMVNSVLRACSETVMQKQSLSTHAPLLDSFFSVLSVILNKKPAMMLCLDGQMQNIIQLGFMTLELPEQGPSKSACNYFGNMSRVRPMELLNYGPTLIQRIIHCIGGLIPRNHIDPFSDLLWKLGRAQWTSAPVNENVPVQGPTHLTTWLRDALQQSGFPTDLATPQVKDKFVKAVVRNFSHKRRIMEAVREFSLSCRGLLGEYGDITQPIDTF